ncbi:MAG: TetM/TetW/TetO/TetS family tetracycline resistance ribosomal protection protein [Eubacterium sp.]|nr:TetM/TetW/TetO/TetS family tetracycline resistance ribosomal protection protein [Eubacterium sp.]
MKQITLGILAHVDGGKTTLSESLLYNTGKIKALGRVDHKNTYLDNFSMERERGITIFSKQAVFEYGDTTFTLLDTPGHVDFSTEMERTLQVLDYAILIVSGSEGVQGHTETLWKLLRKYEIPTFIFVNKMDMPRTNKEFSSENMRVCLGDGIVDFSLEKPDYEQIAMCDEQALEYYMEHDTLTDEILCSLVQNRQLFPCYYGSALNNKGVMELLEGICRYSYEPVYSDDFGAKVYKITKDSAGNRLTHMKITGGSLNVRDEVKGISNGEEWAQKVNDIRIYSGEKYSLVQTVNAGEICAVAGLEETYSGQGLGCESETEEPDLKPVLSYSVLLPKGCNVNQVYQQLKELEEEDPTLNLRWNEETSEIHVRVMGPIQIELLKTQIQERFGIEVSFGTGKILYKETILNTVEGVGHFEPLRHYAEVHLLLEPGEPGSGITFESKADSNSLSRNWQRLIMTHLAEREHRGVLTGAPVTDIHFTLIAGKAHLKHTEGGDFRQATYRAVRQGLKKAESVLLEPYYDFVLDISSEQVGRAMTDLGNMNGHMNPPQIVGEKTRLTGYAPVSEIGDYQIQVNEYSHGKGTLTLKYKGYAPCHNQEQVIEEKGYDSEKDMRNPTGSVFCTHGAGFYVPWDEVEQYMHVKTDLKSNQSFDVVPKISEEIRPKKEKDTYATDQELMAIFEKTFGPVRRKRYQEKRSSVYEKQKKPVYRKKGPNLPSCLLVDGYNIIFAWEELKTLAAKNIDAARDKLLDMLSNYQGYTGTTVIAVFDAYNVKRHKETIYRHQNVYVVFTKEAESADIYIAKTTHQLASKYKITVATSDALEQLIIMGHGALRMSAMNFYEEYQRVEKEISGYLNQKNQLGNYVVSEDELLNG